MFQKQASSTHHIFLQSSMLLIVSKHLVPDDIQQHLFIQPSMFQIFSAHLVPKDIQQHHIFSQALNVTNRQ